MSKQRETPNSYGVIYEWPTWSGDEPVDIPFASKGAEKTGIVISVDPIRRRVFMGIRLSDYSESKEKVDRVIPNASLLCIKPNEFDYDLDYDD